MEYSHSRDNCTAESQPLYIFFSSLLIVEFLLALPLNVTVLYLFIVKMKFWKSKGNAVFLFNIVLADLLVLVLLPVKAYHYQRGELAIRNETLCKAMLFLMFLNRGASIAFLTVVSIDRFVRVVHPQKQSILRVLKRSPAISILIWVFLFPLTIPRMLKTHDCCKNYGPEEDSATDVFREIVFFTQILIPFLILVFCTIQIVNRLNEKTVGDKTKLRRAVFLVTLVVLVFAAVFLPCTLARLVLLIVRARGLLLAEEVVVQVYDGLMCFSYLDCVLDPLVYCFCSTKFKNLYLSTFFPCLLKKEQPDESTNSSGTTSKPKRNNVEKN